MSLRLSELDNLLQRARTIRDEVMHNANTALRVGSLFYDIIMALATINIDELRQIFLTKEEDDATTHKLTMGEAAVTGDASVEGDVGVGGNSTIAGDSVVEGNSTVEGYTNLRKQTTIGTADTQRTGQRVLEVKGESRARTVIFGDYLPGLIAGAEQGAKIEESGDAHFKSVSISEFLEVPEIRFNRASVYIGIGLLSEGGGIIEDVIPDTDGEGNILASGRACLKLEEGEYGAIDLDDFCLGFFHNETVAGDGTRTAVDNSEADRDDHNGDYELCGFQSIYFRIEGIYVNESDYNNDSNLITDRTAQRGANKYFRYVLRTSGVHGWSQRHHPHAGLHFGQIANPTNTSRQNLLVTTTQYTLRLKELVDWNYTNNNIVSIEGNLEGFSMPSVDSQGQHIDKKFHGVGHVLGNAYIFGKLDQFERIGYRCQVDGSLDHLMFPDETEIETVMVFDGYGQDVTSRFTRISVTRESGDAVSDAAWNALHTNVGNPFNIAFADLGIDGLTRTSSLFRVTVSDELTSESVPGSFEFNI